MPSSWGYPWILLGLDPRRGSPGKGHGYPLQYSCLENSMDRGAWWATDHGVTKSGTQLSDWATITKGLCKLTSDPFVLCSEKNNHDCDIDIHAITKDIRTANQEIRSKIVTVILSPSSNHALSPPSRNNFYFFSSPQTWVYNLLYPWNSEFLFVLF